VRKDSKRISEIKTFTHTAFSPSASFGVSHYDKSISYSKLISNTDKALYEAKIIKNTIKIFEPA
jgi:GGDEF domain-containing protein